MARAAGSRPRVVVVGAGIAGLAAARTAVEAREDLDVVVLERARRVGGLVESERTPEGFVVEHGADCLITSKPAGLETARAAGLEGELVAGTGGPRTTFMVRGGRLVALPPGMAFGIPATVGQVARTPVLSWPAKARMAFEPLVPTRGGDADQSVADFIARRFGRRFLERVIDPLLGGIHGVPASELSLEACLPRLRELERTHGSVVVGMRKQARARRGQPAGPPVVSLRRGMESLPAALARSLGERIHMERGVRRIDRRGGGGYRLRLEDGDVLDADAVILAAPAHAAGPMVEGLSRALATMLHGVRHSALHCVTLGWNRSEVSHPLAGTGFLVPKQEGRPTRACSWSSAKWPDRAPDDGALIRSVLDAPDASDDELVAVARRDLRELMGIEADPSLVRVRRRRLGLPVYEVGYLGRLQAMRHAASALGAFALAGNAQGGVGVPDCIQSGREAAGAVLSRLP